MKIYLASGFTITNHPGREYNMVNKFGTWNRLLSYYFFTIDTIYGRELMELKGKINESRNENIF